MYILSLYENAERERSSLKIYVSLKLTVNICLILGLQNIGERRGTRKNVDRNPISVDYTGSFGLHNFIMNLSNPNLNFNRLSKFW